MRFNDFNHFRIVDLHVAIGINHQILVVLIKKVFKHSLIPVAYFLYNNVHVYFKK